MEACTRVEVDRCVDRCLDSKRLECSFPEISPEAGWHRYTERAMMLFKTYKASFVLKELERGKATESTGNFAHVLLIALVSWRFVESGEHNSLVQAYLASELMFSWF